MTYTIKINDLVQGWACREEIVFDILTRLYKQAKNVNISKQLKGVKLLDNEFTIEYTTKEGKVIDKISVKSE